MVLDPCGDIQQALGVKDEGVPAGEKGPPDPVPLAPEFQLCLGLLQVRLYVVHGGELEGGGQVAV